MAEAKKTTKKTEEEPKKEVKKKTVAKKVEKETTKKPAVAKAGKRSVKAVKEAEQKEAKVERKAKSAAAGAEAESTRSTGLPDRQAGSGLATKKVAKKPRVKKYSKNQKAARELIEKDKLYGLKEAVELLPNISKTKFDATAELHVTLNIDPRQADQMVRTNTSLPAGTGKTVKVAVIAGDKEAEAAKKAGADSVDADALIKEITKEKFNFDVLIATPDKMGELGKLAKVLGPKGLMPSPKNGTVTADPAKSVEEFKKGKVELKNDANGIVHVAFGKLSFKNEDLYNNAKAVIKALSNSKPSGVKGVFIRSMFLTSSMSPSIKLDHNEAIKEAKS